MNALFSRRIKPVLAALVLIQQAHAEDRHAPLQATLRTSLLESGQPYELTVRSTELHQPLAILSSLGLQSSQLPDGTWVKLQAPTPLALGSIDTDGRFSWSGIAPLPGFEAFLQPIISSKQGGCIVGNLVPFRVEVPETAAFVDVTPQLPLANQHRNGNDVDAVDLDSDGDLDLVVSDSDGLYFMMNNGHGEFVDQTIGRFIGLRGCDRGATLLQGGGVGACPQAPISFHEFADVDNDGDQDMLLGGDSSNHLQTPNRLYFNDGRGFFALATDFPVGSGVPNDAAFGDIDGDGDLDLILANGRDSAHGGALADPDSLLVNQGGQQNGALGDFVVDIGFANATFNDPNTASSGVALGDLDNDGDLDVLLATTSLTNNGTENIMLRNDGGFVFTDVSATHLVANDLTDNPAEVALADLDGDGSLDAVFAQSLLSAGGPSVMINDGTGILIEDAAFPPPNHDGERIRIGLDLADVDGDGDIDIGFAVHMLFDHEGVPAGQTLLFLNQGGTQNGREGQFELSSDPLHGAMIASDIEFFDFDCDGDEDIYVVSNGDFYGSAPEDRLLRNEP